MCVYVCERGGVGLRKGGSDWVSNICSSSVQGDNASSSEYFITHLLGVAADLFHRRNATIVGDV
jgi:hypothetical protein